MVRAKRWSDNDKYFWIFTLSRNVGWNPWSIIIESGSEENQKDCTFRMSLFGWTILVALPSIIKPWEEWVDLTGYDWAKSKGHYNYYPRKYGFSLNEGFLQVFLGQQTHSSDTTQSWCAHLPWTQWRHVRFSLYDTQGNHWWTYGQDSKDSFEQRQEAPSVSFNFKDHDGEKLVAKTHIQEREWLFGKGWFKWLSIFRKPLIRRTLDISFSGETGKEKGSWKGGTIGHGIEMLKGELHEQAFKRYCEQEHRSKSGKYKIIYVSKIDDAD